MPKSLKIVFVTIATCLATASVVDSHELEKERAGVNERRLQLMEAEVQVQMQALAIKLSELGIEEAKAEMAKVEIHAVEAQKSGNDREARLCLAELKQVQTQVAMREVQTEMARLQMKLAKARLEFIKSVQPEPVPAKASVVQVEYLDESGVIVLRGTHGDVKALQKLIEAAAKSKIAEQEDKQ